jgi:hypothetical protein
MNPGLMAGWRGWQRGTAWLCPSGHLPLQGFGVVVARITRRILGWRKRKHHGDRALYVNLRKNVVGEFSFERRHDSLKDVLGGILCTVSRWPGEVEVRLHSAEIVPRQRPRELARENRADGEPVALAAVGGFVFFLANFSASLNLDQELGERQDAGMVWNTRSASDLSQGWDGQGQGGGDLGAVHVEKAAAACVEEKQNVASIPFSLEPLGVVQ